jgi:uncharacterized membrane protein
MSESATPSPASPGQQPGAPNSLVPALGEFKKASFSTPLEAPKNIPSALSGEVKSIEFSMMRRSAPLPLPSELAAYNEVIPQGADRIMKMAEAQSAHRIEIEKKVVFGQQGQESRGQYLAFIIAIVGLVCGAYTAVAGQPAAGAAIAGVPLVGIVSAFLYSKHRDTADLEEKREQMDSVEPKPPPNQNEKSQKKNKNRRR